jgi:hypothetical protein
MKFRLQVAMDNAAFEDQGELPRILHDLARHYESVDPGCEQLHGASRRLCDINGNHVGNATITK